MFEEIENKLDELLGLINGNKITPNELENELYILRESNPAGFDLIINIGYNYEANRWSPFQSMIQTHKYDYAEIFLKYGRYPSFSFPDIIDVLVDSEMTEEHKDVNIIKNMLVGILKNNDKFHNDSLKNHHIRIFLKGCQAYRIPKYMFVFCCEKINENIINIDHQILLMMERTSRKMNRSEHVQFFDCLTELLNTFNKKRIIINDNTIRKIVVHTLEKQQNIILPSLERVLNSKLNTAIKEATLLFLAENYVINPYIPTDDNVENSSIIDSFARFITSDDPYYDEIAKCRNLIMSKYQITQLMAVIPFPILEELEPNIKYDLIKA